jgi:hypothetical protein
MRKIHLLVITCIAIWGNSCASATSQESVNENLKSNSVDYKTQNTNSFDSLETAELLCSKLNELKRMPNKDKSAGDIIYDGLIDRGKKTIPCLIERITDTTIMEDPREAPHIQDFKVGDAAVFMLHRIAEKPLQDILPDDVKKHWETEGVYAYFNYVENPKNRKKIKVLWEIWNGLK